VTECDLTHKPQYSDEKLESGGKSYETMENVVARVYTTNMISTELTNF
jgi:hypothetical protein